MDIFLWNYLLVLPLPSPRFSLLTCLVLSREDIYFCHFYNWMNHGKCVYPCVICKHVSYPSSLKTETDFHTQTRYLPRTSSFLLFIITLLKRGQGFSSPVCVQSISWQSQEMDMNSQNCHVKGRQGTQFACRLLSPFILAWTSFGCLQSQRVRSWS